VDSMAVMMLLIVLGVGLGLYIGLTRLNKQRSGLDHAYYQKQWQMIEGYKNNGGAGLQLAVLEADKLLDHALKHRGYQGQTMGDRLKSARGSFMNNDAVWQAHKLRNRLAHEQNVPLNSLTVDQALRGLKAALKDLGAL
jgi:hypothetical protein